MNHLDIESPKQKATPVDDVRKVRQKLSREFGDIRGLGAYAQKIAEEYRERLGLKSIKAPELKHPSEVCINPDFQP